MPVRLPETPAMPMPDEPGPDRWPTRLRRLLLPDCREMSRLTSRSMDAPPGLIQRMGMGLHWLLCTTCRRYRLQLLWLRRVAGLSQSPPVDGVRIRLAPEARERLLRRLRDAGGESGSQGGDRP